VGGRSATVLLAKDLARHLWGLGRSWPGWSALRAPRSTPWRRSDRRPFRPALRATSKHGSGTI